MSFMIFDVFSSFYLYSSFFIACNTSNLNENDIILDSDSKSCDYRASLNYTFASVLLFCWENCSQILFDSSTIIRSPGSA